MEYLKRETQYITQVMNEEKYNLLRDYVNTINIVMPKDYENLSYNLCIERTINRNYNILSKYNYYQESRNCDSSKILLLDIINLYVYSRTLENVCDKLEMKNNNYMLESKNDCNGLFVTNNRLVKNNQDLLNELDIKDNFINQILILLILSNLFLIIYLICGTDKLFLHVNYLYDASFQIINWLTKVFNWIYINCYNLDYSFLNYNNVGITIYLILIPSLLVYMLRKLTIFNINM